MKIVSWNVNGLRAVARKDLLSPVFYTLRPDILLVQETKATEDQIEKEVGTIPSYRGFFNASQTRAGYSGVGLYLKKEAEEVTYGMGVSKYDMEGRVITAHYENLIVSNIYFPNGGQGPDRLQYKLEFYDVFLEYIDGLRKKSPVVWGGDVNTAHEAIDLARPKDNEKNTGFLPIERAWLDEVIAHGWIDTFRSAHPHESGAYTYWDMKTRARERNVGWRIDYLFMSSDLEKKLKKATIHNGFFGSDHCPISVDL